MGIRGRPSLIKAKNLFGTHRIQTLTRLTPNFFSTIAADFIDCLDLHKSTLRELTLIEIIFSDNDCLSIFRKIHNHLKLDALIFDALVGYVENEMHWFLCRWQLWC
jgi:hypothetical protein